MLLIHTEVPRCRFSRSYSIKGVPLGSLHYTVKLPLNLRLEIPESQARFMTVAEDPSSKPLVQGPGLRISNVSTEDTTS